MIWNILIFSKTTFHEKKNSYQNWLSCALFIEPQKCVWVWMCVVIVCVFALSVYDWVCVIVRECVCLCGKSAPIAESWKYYFISRRKTRWKILTTIL